MELNHLSTVLTSNTVLYIILAFLTLTAVGVLMYTYNLGKDNTNLLKKTTDSKVIPYSYQVVVTGGFVISVTLLIAFVVVVIGDSVKPIFTAYSKVTIVPIIYYALLATHNYHLTQATPTTSNKT